jgi:hypothetical protein
MGEVARAGAEKFRDALFYKVAALKQGVAPEPYGDLVSRTRAIEELRAEMKRHGAGDVCNLDGTFSDGDADTCNQADYAAITALKRGVDRISALEGNAASNGVGQMDDLEAAFKKLRREVALSRSTPGSSLETLCQQIDRIIGKAL